MSGNLEGKGRGKILADAEHAASVTDLVKEEVCYSDSRNMNFVESFQQNSTCEYFNMPRKCHSICLFHLISVPIVAWKRNFPPSY